MEPLYLEASIKKKKAAIQAAPDTTNYEVFRIVTYYSELIEASLSHIRDSFLPIQQEKLPTMDQATSGMERLGELLQNITALLSAEKDLYLLTTSDSWEEDQKILQSTTQDLLVPIKNQLAELQNDIHQTLIRFSLQKAFLLHRESTQKEPSNLRLLTGAQLAGQYIYLSDGNLKTAKTLLTYLAEELAAIQPTPARLHQVLEALSQFTSSESKFENRTFVQPSYANRGEEGFFQPTPEPKEEPQILQKTTATLQTTNHERTEHTEQSCVEDKPPEPETTEQNQEFVIQKTSEEEILQPPQDEQPAPPGKKTISRSEYHSIRDEVTRLRENYEEALQRQMAIQKEIGADFTKATKEQNTKMIQIRTAVQDTHAKLKAAAERLDKLNRDIRDGKIEIEKPQKKIISEQLKTRKPHAP